MLPSGPEHAPGALLLKEGSSPEKKPSGQPVDAPEKAPPDGPLCCVHCGHSITLERHRTTVNGRHAHTRVNPYGFVFHFGCFAQAEGCLVEGPPTAEDSWFAGYVWEFAHCAVCRTHLGWAFQGEGSFFGLLLDRLAAPH
ncbi:cereblon family protein [Hyalangium rubrum]|uniref:Cereblon family protein n=1 Tax=Hyalangium rubrum TaxID=3103134 RepID=A0ABU5H8V4_9BACT|nr:cereblon family protein [Hyalangium sp. s54d21]MDY7229197.1 cereblon family protein [Hyalangium sp. s54d21]